MEVGELRKLTLSLHQTQSEIKLFVYDSTYTMYTTPNQTKALTQSPNGLDEPGKFYLDCQARQALGKHKIGRAMHKTLYS